MFKSFQIQCIRRGPVTIDLFFSLIALSITEVLLCEVDAHFPGRFAPIILANHIHLNVWVKFLAESSGKMCINFAQRYLRNGLDTN